MEMHKDQGVRGQFKQTPHFSHVQLHLPTGAPVLGYLRCQHAQRARFSVLATCAKHAPMGHCTHKCLARVSFFIPSGYLTPHLSMQHAPLICSGSKKDLAF